MNSWNLHRSAERNCGFPVPVVRSCSWCEYGAHERHTANCHCCFELSHSPFAPDLWSRWFPRLMMQSPQQVTPPPTRHSEVLRSGRPEYLLCQRPAAPRSVRNGRELTSTGHTTKYGQWISMLEHPEGKGTPPRSNFPLCFRSVSAPNIKVSLVHVVQTTSATTRRAEP